MADLEDVCDLSKDAVIVRLHGFFQTDDRIAIQEITRQLFLEKEAEKQSFGTFSGRFTFVKRVKPRKLTHYGVLTQKTLVFSWNL